MLKPLVSRFLQHLTSQNNWSRAHLQVFSGKVVQFNIAFIKTNLQVLEDGSLSIAGETIVPEAFIHIPPSLAIRILAGDEAAKKQIKIDGDAVMAAELGKVLQLMRWDVEEDLSKIIGDIAANKTTSAAKKVFAEAKKQAINSAEMLSEFWQEEKPVLAKKRHVTQFNAEVDTLRSDVARFEKKLEKLLKKTNESSVN
jgi:ubiquinone biosynthesis accessory factor UbiJ